MKKHIYIIVLSAIILILSALAAISIGSINLSFQDIYAVLAYKLLHIQILAGYSHGITHDIVWFLRLPRVLLAICVGAGLAVCGVVMQAIVRNPLADPYIMGISSGAALGATTAIMLGIGTALGDNFIGIVASLGAFMTAVAVVFISNLGSRANSMKLLLAGMALSSVCTAFSSFIVYFSNNKEGIQSIAYWLMGSLANANIDNIAIVFMIVLLGCIFFWTQSNILNLMLLGDEVAITLGTNLHTYRQIYILVAAIITGFIVYSAGMIGFVGLIIPHAIRMFGGSDHKIILPLSMLGGAIFLIWSDVAARTFIEKSEIPIGILVSLIGAPCFIYLMIKKSYGFGGGS